MEIYFDRKTTRIVRYIKYHANCTVDDLRRRFGDFADAALLINLCKAGYLVCMRGNGRYTVFAEPSEQTIKGNERFWLSPKAHKMLEDRFDRIWQWAIPTLISVAALIVSILNGSK